MLLNLQYDVRFERTGRRLQEKINFQKGFGAIVGPNESGKSMILEMIRYALFGTAALRGPISDYANLDVSLVFTIKGVTYTVDRGLKACTLSSKGIVEATGTKPVNAKIVKILGFGLEVFDMSCASMQGDIEKLGSIRPAERKRLVDSVIGLTVIEDLAKMANEHANGFKKEAEAFEAALVKPEEPIAPPGYDPDKTRRRWERMATAMAEYNQLVGALSVGRTAPLEPKDPGILESLEVLEVLSQAQNEKISRLNQLIDKLKYKPSVVIPKDTIEEHIKSSELWEERLGHVRALEAAQQRLDRARMQAITCPNCDHQFHLDGSQVKDLEDEAWGLKIQIEQYPSTRPPHSIAELLKLRNQPDWGALQIEHDALVDELQNSGQPNYHDRYWLKRDYELARLHYQDQMVDYQNWADGRERSKTRIAQLEVRLSEHDRVQEEYKLGLQYEALIERYHPMKAKYDEYLEVISDYKRRAEDWKKAKQSLDDLRVAVKQHIIPSLNVWASALLTQMTGGQRNLIEVDEDFNIMVDRQSIDTLSGSGKAVANLALRIGLGQVLTNGVLSLFIGDEIDASMDSDRAENTSNALQTLRKSLLQILLISHKSVQADYYINLGNDDDQPE